MKVIEGRGALVREAATQRVRAGAVIKTPADFMALVKAASQEVRRTQAWKDRRAA